MPKILRPCLLLILVLVAVGCQGTVPLLRARQPDESVVYLYLQPLLPEAARLRVLIDGVSAVREDGREIPLSLSLRELSAAQVSRQRLLAAGGLPAGDYAGFVFRTKSASLTGEEAASSLLVPEAGVKIDFSFVLRRGQGAVIALALRYAQSIEPGFGFKPSFSVYRPDRPAIGLMGFVANSRSNDVTVFDKKSLQVFDVVATGQVPSALALDQQARKAYIALSGEDGIEVLDVAAGAISDRVRLTAGDDPADIALTPDGRTLLSANRGSNTVSVIDTGSRYELSKIAVGSGPRWITIDRAGRRAFVLNTVSNTISVIDLSARAVVRTIPTEPGPIRGEFNRRGDRLYVIHEVVPYVIAVNPDTLIATGRFRLRSPMQSIKVDPNTDFVYLAAPRDFVVGLYDPFSFGPVDFLDTHGPIADMATDGDENNLYLVSDEASRVVVFQRIRKRIVGELDVGAGPSRIAVMGEN